MTHANPRRAIGGALVALSLVAVFAGTVLATPANQFVGTALAKGDVDQATFQYNEGAIKLMAKGPVVLNMASVNVAAGGTSGWHSHPGLVLVVVKQGAMTFYDKDCNPTVHPAGSSFIEAQSDGSGLARNEGATEAIVYVTYIAPAGTTAFRVDEPNPGCAQS